MSVARLHRGDCHLFTTVKLERTCLLCIELYLMKNGGCISKIYCFQDSADLLCITLEFSQNSMHYCQIINNLVPLEMKLGCLIKTHSFDTLFE